MACGTESLTCFSVSEATPAHSGSEHRGVRTRKRFPGPRFESALRILVLAYFQVFDPIKFEIIGHFVEDALGIFWTLVGKLADFVFRLEETGKRDDNRDGGQR